MRRSCQYWSSRLLAPSAAEIPCQSPHELSWPSVVILSAGCEEQVEYSPAPDLFPAVCPLTTPGRFGPRPRQGPSWSRSAAKQPPARDPRRHSTTSHLPALWVSSPEARSRPALEWR